MEIWDIKDRGVKKGLNKAFIPADLQLAGAAPGGGGVPRFLLAFHSLFAGVMRQLSAVCFFSIPSGRRGCTYPLMMRKHWLFTWQKTLAPSHQARVPQEPRGKSTCK